MGDQYDAGAEICKVEATPATLTDSLKSDRHKAQQKVDALDETIALIESQPAIQKVLDALSKLGRLRNY